MLGSSSLNALGKGKPDKPDKPPGKPEKPGEEATWAAELPLGSEGTMLYGDGSTYINNGNDIRVKMERLTTRFTKGIVAYSYYFCFKLVNPTDRYAGFQDVLFDDYNEPSEPYCVFPGGCDLYTPPSCMEYFLNTFNQPYSDSGDEYEYFYIKFWVSEHSFDGRTLEEMPIGIPYQLSGKGNNRIKLRIQNKEDFIDPSIEYHNIESYEITWGEYALDIWIKRTADNVWRISVEGEDLWVQETYTVRKKGREKTETVVPLEAVDNFFFYIEFIKNPTTQ